MSVRIKRAYDDVSPDDGYRIFVDRLWPRGLSKDAARLDWWLKDIAPSTELRNWFGHDPAKWQEFQYRYREELAVNDATVELLRTRLREGPATIVCGAKDELHNHAIVLRSYLESS